MELARYFAARCSDQAGCCAVHEVAQLWVLVTFVGARGLLLVHLKHDLTVGLFGTMHWVRSHLAIDTGVVGPVFFGRNCINGTVGVFAF